MGNKTDKLAAAGKAVKGEFNFIWFFIAAAVGSAIFFSISRWLSAPPEKFAHCRGHLCPKAAPAEQVKRGASGYKVSY